MNKAFINSWPDPDATGTRKKDDPEKSRMNDPSDEKREKSDDDDETKKTSRTS